MTVPLTLVNMITDPQSTVRMRWKEPYVTEGLNVKDAILLPAGIYRGFQLFVPAGQVTTYSLQIVADAAADDSVAVVISTNGAGLKRALTVRYQPGAVFPPTDLVGTLGFSPGDQLVVALYGFYEAAQPSQLLLRVYKLADYLAAAEKNDLVVLGQVNVPVAPPLLPAHLDFSLTTIAWQNKSPGELQWESALQNGGFEQGAGGNAPVGSNQFPSWTVVSLVNCSAQLATATPHSGARYLQLFAGGAGAVTGTTVAQSINAPCPSGVRVRVRGFIWVKQASVAAKLEIQPNYGTVAFAPLTQSALVDCSVADTGWRAFDFTFVAPATAAYLTTLIVQTVTWNAAAAAAFVLLDDLEVLIESAAVLGPKSKDAKFPPLTALRVQLGSVSDTNPSTSTAQMFFDGSFPVGEGEVVGGRADGQISASVLPPQLTWQGRLRLGDALGAVAAQAMLPRISTPPSALSSYTLVSEAALPGGASARAYCASTAARGGVTWVVNATWNTGTSRWVREIAGMPAISLALGVATGGATLPFVCKLSRAGTVNWLDSTGPGGWDSQPFSLTEIAGVTPDLVDSLLAFSGQVNAGVTRSTKPQADSAAFQATTAPTSVSDRTCLMAFLPAFGDGTQGFRLYRTNVANAHGEVFELVLNASWDSTAALWTADLPGAGTTPAARFQFGNAGLRITGVLDASTPWSDTSWIGGGLLHLAGSQNSELARADIELSTGNVLHSGFNIPKLDLTRGADNVLYAGNIPKAWGSVTIWNTPIPGIGPPVLLSSSFTKDSFGVLSVYSATLTTIPSAQGLRVFLANPMANALYTVEVTMSDVWGFNGFVMNKTPGSFDLGFFETGVGGMVDAASVDSAGLTHLATVDFQVFGRSNL